jgi:transcriptional regulator with XRE-family HTH domain
MKYSTTGLRCHCGGALRHTSLSAFDFSGFAGIPVTLNDAPGFTCRKCGGKTISGTLIKPILAVVGLEIARLPARLDAGQARFLRKQLGLTQQQLADRMDIDRVTVANWETGKEISPQHDLILRTLALSGLSPILRSIFKPAYMAESMNTCLASLAAVRKDLPTPGAELHPVVLKSLLEKLRTSARGRAGI